MAFYLGLGHAILQIGVYRKHIREICELREKWHRCIFSLIRPFRQLNEKWQIGRGNGTPKKFELKRLENQKKAWTMAAKSIVETRPRNGS